MTPDKEAERQLDAQLLARIASGDEAAFGALYDRFSPGLFSFVLKMVHDEKEAEDVLQDGFSHIWRRASTYDPARSSPFTWAVMILRNKAIDRLRIRQRQERTLERATIEFSHFPEADTAAAGAAERHDNGALVRSALTQISSDQKQAVELAFFSGLTHEQIAKQLNTPLGTVKARIRRGLLKLPGFPEGGCMIDEHRQELAADYVLGALDATETRAFEADLARDPELRALTDELYESTAALVHAVPRQFPSPELRERVLSAVRAEASFMTSSTPATAPVQSKGGVGMLPWVLAAGFALTTAALWFERDQLRIESKSLRQEAITLRTRDGVAKERVTALTQEVETLRKQATDLQGRDALSQMRIATLSAQVESLAKGTAVVVWDSATQRGIVRLANLPKPEAGKDYQLWVIDPKYPQPVSGGVLPVQEDGSAQIGFKAEQPIEKADKFAISVEPAGGVPQATGPIVLLGN